MDWDDARFFLAAYRNGSLAAAAAALGCSHSTVRRRLAALERTLGARLFTATSDGLIPSDAAAAAYPLAEDLEAAAARLADRMAGDARELTGRLLVTTIDGLVYLLADSIRAFTSRHPRVDLILNTDNRVLDLARREADVAIRMSNRPSEALFGRRIGSLDYAPFAAPSLAAAHQDAPQRAPWILWEERLGATATDDWHRRWSGDGGGVLRVTSGVAMLALARAGVAGAALPIPIGVRAGLTQLGPPIDGFRTDVWCLTHPDLRYSARVRGFMEIAALGGGDAHVESQDKPARDQIGVA